MNRTRGYAFVWLWNLTYGIIPVCPTSNAVTNGQVYSKRYLNHKGDDRHILINFTSTMGTIKKLIDYWIIQYYMILQVHYGLNNRRGKFKKHKYKRKNRNFNFPFFLWEKRWIINAAWNLKLEISKSIFSPFTWKHFRKREKRLYSEFLSFQLC